MHGFIGDNLPSLGQQLGLGDGLKTLGTMENVCHQMSPHRSMHRLVHISGAKGEWQSYTTVATLECQGTLWLATTDAHRNNLPQIMRIAVYENHRDFDMED